MDFVDPRFMRAWVCGDCVLQNHTSRRSFIRATLSITKSSPSRYNMCLNVLQMLLGAWWAGDRPHPRRNILVSAAIGGDGISGV